MWFDKSPLATFLGCSIPAWSWLLAKIQWDGGDTILPPTPKQERTTLLLPLDGGKKKRKIHPKKRKINMTRFYLFVGLRLLVYPEEEIV